MRVAGHPYLRRLAKPLACVLAICALTFLLQIAPHSHSNSQDEAACRVCQAAHLGVSPAVRLPNLSVPLMSFGAVAKVVPPALADLFFEQSPSRAPPRLVL
jgi:hypothetical protein